MNLDQSQLKFCRSKGEHVRLLAPAGCGKTLALLHRCVELAKRAKSTPRFLVVTFTKAATHELRGRLSRDPAFETIKDHITISTLNAYGFRRMHNQLSNTRLLSSNNDRYFAMKNQLRPVWLDKYPHVQAVAVKRGTGARRLMNVMDDLKALGFDHTTDTNYERFKERLEAIQQSPLAPQMELQFETLTQLKVLDSKATTDGVESAADSPRAFYDRFFRFWRDAVASLHNQLTFTFEDQKYWCWLDLRSPDADGKAKPAVTGIARFDHILVDEFQDINALDLALIQTLVDRHRSSITIAGDDDQAIFEWRGATPEYILSPEAHFDVPFATHVLDVNYRSPSNIVQHSQKLIAHNERRVDKPAQAAPGAPKAEISVVRTDSIGHRLSLVTEIAQATPSPGRVAVIGRVRSQLIPYEVYYAAGGGEVRTATDLDALASSAFDDLLRLLEIWDRGTVPTRATRVADDSITVFNLIRKAPFSKKNDESVRQFLKALGASTCTDAATAFARYDGPKLTGKPHEHLSDVAAKFLNASTAWQAIECIADDFDGLRFDYEKSEDDVWYTDPPLKQLAEMAHEEHLNADDLIGRLEAARDQVKHFQGFDDDEDPQTDDERTLQLMTATRAKGKEFDTVIMLDTGEGMWPHKRAKTKLQVEAERRLFYVAFTRARKRIVMLMTENAPLSRFAFELGLPEGDLPVASAQGPVL